MLYNKEQNRVKQDTDCAGCQYFDIPTKTCSGIGKNCFEYDKITGTCIDPITKLAFDPKETK